MEIAQIINKIGRLQNFTILNFGFAIKKTTKIQMVKYNSTKKSSIDGLQCAFAKVGRY